MLLNRIYSEPEGLFDQVDFQSGINFVYAKKDNKKESKKSLNGVGKSLLLNLIDFCLLSSETQHIKSAKNSLDLKKYSVVLEFSINNTDYKIKRSFKEPNKEIFFGKIGDDLKSYNNTNGDKVLNNILCDLIFKNDNYSGKYFNAWLRKLLPFFIKKQSTKSKINFKDPINYLHDNSKTVDLIPLHLFLMDIDNTLMYKNSVNCSEIKSKGPALKEVESLVQDKYNLKDIPQAESEIDKLRARVKVLQNNIDNFKLADQYKDVEDKSNELTSKIKDLKFINFSNKRKIDNYEESYLLSDDINTIRIKNLYKDLNTLLAENIKKTLDEAIKFRKSIAESRKEFLSNEISTLKNEIEENDKIIISLETERAKLFHFLQAKEAIKDLSEAYLQLNKRTEDLSDLEGKIKTYRDLKSELAEREAESAKLYADIEKFANTIQSKLSEFRQMFFEIHDAIYAENKGDSDFIFTPNKGKDSKIDMDVILPSELSYGKNRGRTLIYDLTVLFHAINKNINCPRFLIHDGIFDGMDKAHFVHLYNYLDKLKEGGLNFQYIVTLNQDGEIKDTDFGEGAEELTREKIESEAVALLTPSKPLFKEFWK